MSSNVWGISGYALLTSARKRVHDNEYEYKKGKSRSVQLDHRNSNKRQKIDASTRTKQLSDLEQRLININLSIKMKQNRCQEIRTTNCVMS